MKVSTVFQHRDHCIEKIAESAMRLAQLSNEYPELVPETIAKIAKKIFAESLQIQALSMNLKRPPT